MADRQPMFDRAEDLGAIDEELVIRPRRMRRPDTDMDITPMIDITFLLLIFFLVSAFLSRQAPVELPPARYGDAVAPQEAAIVTIAADGTGGAVIYKGDVAQDTLRLASGDLESQERELVAYLQAEFDADPLKRHVLIKAGRNVKQRHVVRVSHAAAKVLTRGRLFVAVREED